MKRVTSRRFLSMILSLLLLTPSAALAQQKPATATGPDPRQVFNEIIKPYRTLNDYTVKISAKVSMPTIRIPNFTATLYFKKPDRFHIETKSFAPIPRNGGLFNPFQFDPEKNRITYQKTESLDGALADLYRVEPLDAKSQVRYYQVWVGGIPGRILQVQSLSFRGTKGMMKLSYGTVTQGTETWLLPEKIRIHLIFPEEAATPEASVFNTRDNPFSGGMRRLDEVGGEGDIDIAYSNWQVNTGLDESLFQK